MKTDNGTDHVSEYTTRYFHQSIKLGALILTGIWEYFVFHRQAEWAEVRHVLQGFSAKE